MKVVRPTFLLLSAALLAGCYDEPEPVMAPSHNVVADDADRIKWRLKLPGDYAGNPLVAPDGTIYVTTVNGRLYAIDPAGSVRWIHVIGGGAIWGPLSRLADGTIVTAGERSVVAVTPAGGRRWTFAAGDYIVGGPNVGPDGNVYAVTDILGIGLFSLTPDGAKRYNTGQFSTYGNNHSHIAFSSGQMFFSFDMPTLRPQPTFFSYDLDGNKEWEIQAVSPNTSPTASPNGNVIIPHGSPLHAYNPAGQKVWTFYDPQPTGWLRPVIGSNNILYGVQALSHLYSVDANGNQRWALHDNVILKGPNVRAQNDLLLMGGRLNFGSTGFIQAVDAYEGTPLWREMLPDEPGFEPHGQLEPTSTPAFSPDGATGYLSVDVLEASAGEDYFYFYAVNLGGAAPPPNQPPVAQITAEETGREGQPITFSSAGSNDADGDAVTYHWSFGDGVTSTLPNPVHRYADNGTYVVALTVSDARGAYSSERKLIDITNEPPSAEFDIPTTVYEGSSYLNVLTASDPGSADLSTLQVALDCGQQAGYQSVTVRAVAPCPVIRDQTAVTLRARVRDKDGAQSDFARNVSILNAAPVVTFIATTPTTIRVGERVLFEGRFTDAGVNDAPWQYSFSWGHRVDTPGHRTTSQGAVISEKHTFPAAGTFNVTMRVTDKDGREGVSRPITITVTRR